MTEDDNETVLTNSISHIEVDLQNSRFSGKSSSVILIHMVLELKSEYYDGVHLSHVHPTKRQLNQREEFWMSQPVHASVSLFLPYSALLLHHFLTKLIILMLLLPPVGKSPRFNTQPSTHLL
jgi:hypothetical protein